MSRSLSLLLLLVVAIPPSFTILIRKSTGIAVVGNLKVTGRVTEGVFPCCATPSAAFLHTIAPAPTAAVVSINFEPLSNIAYAATMLGGVQLQAQGTPLPTFKPNGDRKGSSSMVYAYNGAGTLNTAISPIGMPTGDSPHTIAIWFKANSSGAVAPGCGMFWLYGILQTKMLNCLRFNGCTQVSNFMSGFDASWTTPASMCNNTWQHIAFVYDSAKSAKTLYLNGVSLGAVAAVGGVNIPEGPIWLGGYGPIAERFWGELDDFHMFSTALNATSILALYRS